MDFFSAKHAAARQILKELEVESPTAYKCFFSKTGFILRPHRRCMQDDLAENLFYCKENINFL